MGEHAIEWEAIYEDFGARCRDHQHGCEEMAKRISELEAERDELAKIRAACTVCGRNLPTAPDGLCFNCGDEVRGG